LWLIEDTEQFFNTGKIDVGEVSCARGNFLVSTRVGPDGHDVVENPHEDAHRLEELEHRLERRLLDHTRSKLINGEVRIRLWMF